MTCEICTFSQILISKGDSYSFLDPNGEEVVRTHLETILECRAMPPLGGSWPHVSPEDWCGYFKEG